METKIKILHSQINDFRELAKKLGINYEIQSHRDGTASGMISGKTPNTIFNFMIAIGRQNLYIVLL